MLYNIPIESLEERYSAQWNDNIFPVAFERLKVNYSTIHPKPLDNKINQGKFLDIVGTNYFKAKQLEEICELFNSGAVKDGDVFFFHDLWFPGIEMLFYMRDALELNIKIGGMLHAGTYDEYDFLAQQGMDKWGKDLEKSWFKGLDFIFVATNFHKELLEKTERINYHTRDKVHVTGFPLPVNIFITGEDYAKKENIVVFPHRMDDEKNPEDFKILASVLNRKYPSWKFVFTKEECKTKQEYYDLLKRAKIAVSFANQETWGIAQQEAYMSGCIPVVPNRLSYKELYNEKYRYDNRFTRFYVIETYVEYFMNHYEKESMSSTFQIGMCNLQRLSGQSITNMIRTMQNLGGKILSNE